MINQLISQFYYRFTKPREVNEANQEKIGDKYSPKHIARLLTKKDPNGKAAFYFKGMNDYITLSSNGHLNVRGEEEMFRAWGSSEFRNLKPQTVFEELEKEIVKIKVISVPGKNKHSFNSYSEFINWLVDKKG